MGLTANVIARNTCAFGRPPAQRSTARRKLGAEAQGRKLPIEAARVGQTQRESTAGIESNPE